MTTMASLDLVILYALSHKLRLAPKKVGALLAVYGSPQGIWDVEPEEIAEVVKLDQDAVEELHTLRDTTEVLSQEIEYMLANGISIVGVTDTLYPSRLRRLGDPPSLLYIRGTLPPDSQTTVAVVGSHQADAEGIGEAVEWGKGLAERDAVVVSGLARGIDGGAHTGALAADGITIAVLGSGFENVYPPEHQALAEEITTQGALVSEYHPSAPLTKARLVHRNRLIAALSLAVVVVRVTEDTRGSMETIRRASDVASPVFLVTTDADAMSQKAVAEGAIPIGHIPDFDLVLSYL